MNAILQIWIPLISSVVTITTGLVSIVRYITAHKKHSEEKSYSYKDVVGYVLIPIFLILTGIILYLGSEANMYLLISFAISTLSVIYLAVIAYLSFNATEIIAPEWLWKLLFNKISTRFESASKSEINVLLLYASDCESQAKEIQDQNEANSLNIVHFNCNGKTRQELKCVLENNTFFGIYILLSPELESEQNEWYFDCCQSWANNNMDKPIVYSPINTKSRLHFGKVSREKYKYGILRLFERTQERADLWERQSKNYRIACFAIILLGFLGFCTVGTIQRKNEQNHKKELQERDKKVEVLKGVFEKYDGSFYDNKGSFEKLKKAKNALKSSVFDGIFLDEYSCFQYQAKSALQKIYAVNNLNYDTEDVRIELTFWKMGYDNKIHKIAVNTAQEKTEGKIWDFDCDNVIGGAFTYPGNFILYIRDSTPQIYAKEVNVVTNEEKENPKVALNVKFSKESEKNTKYDKITAILAYCFDVDNSEESERIGATIRIESLNDYKFLEEKSTMVILRESLKEIWLFPRNLFFAPKDLKK
ncbi:MAG: hypothetical protein LBI82_08335 [Dysgonamonadaceae bacterium]|jgi:hypothetical protein|nr:hypothetical protein [Dysgonamonadaceae bacterium]